MSQSETKVSLSPDLTSAQTADGQTISFSRSEARALSVLTRNPNRIVTRDQLLDALSGEGSDKNDRIIDFVINRLRRKLSDSARNPRYIATRYGEGYLWVAETFIPLEDLANADMIIGPVQGLDLLGPHKAQAEMLIQDIQRAVKADLGRDKRIALAPDCPPASSFATGAPDQAVELVFFRVDDTLNCVATVKEFSTGRILAIRRTTLDQSADGPLQSRQVADALVAQLLNNTWRALATQPEAAGPLPVSMYDAEPIEDPGLGDPTESHRDQLKFIERATQSRHEAWKRTNQRLVALRAADPTDPLLKVMHATHIHTKYVTLGLRLFADGIDDRRQDEDEIETLVSEALPQVQNQPEYAIMAAKLLHFLDRGYGDLARGLAEDAYRSSVSVSGSLAVIGQLRAFGGDTDAALQCIDQALAFLKPGSRAHIYTLVLKCQALMAVDDRQRLAEAKREFYGVSPVAALFFEPLFSDPDKLSLRARIAARTMSGTRSAALVQFNHYVSARLFDDPTHRENLMRTPLTLVMRRYGTQLLPGEVTRAYPELVSRLSRRS